MTFSNADATVYCIKKLLAKLRATPQIRSTSSTNKRVAEKAIDNATTTQRRHRDEAYLRKVCTTRHGVLLIHVRDLLGRIFSRRALPAGEHYNRPNFFKTTTRCRRSDRSTTSSYRDITSLRPILDQDVHRRGLGLEKFIARLRATTRCNDPLEPQHLAEEMGRSKGDTI